MGEDAIEEVVDTSDVEEKELIEAQKPGYYDRVWGAAERSGGLAVDMEVDDYDGKEEKVSLARLQSRTPSHKRIQIPPNYDPSPVLSCLQISSNSQLSDAQSTTPVLSASKSQSRSRTASDPPDSSVTFSPTNFSVFQEEEYDPQAASNISSGRSLVDALTNGLSELDSSQDPLCLLSPMAPTRFPARLLISGDHDLARDGFGSINMTEKEHGEDAKFNQNPAESTEFTQDASIDLIYDGFNTISQDYPSSPPLEFPSSPMPDAPSFSPVDTHPDSNPFLVPRKANSKSPKPTNVSHTSDSGVNVNQFMDAKVGEDAHSVLGGSPDPLPDVATNISPYRTLDLRLPSSSSPRFNSVSSPHASSPVRPSGPQDPQNGPFRSMSPLTPPPSSQPSSSRLPRSPSSDLAPAAVSSPIIIPPDLEPETRAYSFRQRSAKQLNPFAYDKRQYKQQLRGMPEAIVKDPNMGGGRAGRKERYREEGEGEDDWENGEGDAMGDGDGDEEWRAREQRKERQRAREAANAMLQELRVEIESSGEGGEMLMEIGGTGGEEGDMRGKKRKRTHKVRKFTMVTEQQNTEGLQASSSSSRRQSTPPAEPHPRPRPRPDFRTPSPTLPPSVRAPSAIPMDVDFDFGGDIDGGTGDAEDPWPLQTKAGESSPSVERSKVAGRSLIDVDSSEDDSARPRSRRGRLRRGRPDDNDSDVQILDDDPEGVDGAGSEDGNGDSQGSQQVPRKDRKNMKVLNRMVPAVMVNKFLGANQAKRKAKERTHHQESEDDENAPLQPGRGRKRIVSPSSRDPKRYEIKGDTESESESQGHSYTSDQEVIVVKDDGGSEEDAERALEESEDGLDDDDIQTWLAPEPLHDELTGAAGQAPRVRRSEAERDRPRGGDLIDRMLQRTRRVGPRPPRPMKKHKSKPRGSRNPALDTATREARPSDAGREGERQSKPTNPKADVRGEPSTGKRRETSAGARSGPVQAHQEHRVDVRDDKRKKSKKRKRDAAQGTMSINYRKGHKVTTGRQVIHIDNDDDAFHEALAPEVSTVQTRPRSRPKAKINPKSADDVRDKFRPGAHVEPDAFDLDMHGAGQQQSKILLDFDILLLRPGITLGSDGYVGKGRLHDFIAILNGNEAPVPVPATIFGLQIDPEMPITQMSPAFAAVCDKLYDASIISVDDPEAAIAVKASDVMMHTLCQIITFKALHINDEEMGLLTTVVSEQVTHLVRRIDGRLDLLSADGHTLDFRSLALYWFAVEVHLRLVYAHRKRPDLVEDPTFITTHAAERSAVQLLQRLLEYGFDRTIGLVMNEDQVLDTTFPNVRSLELLVCVFYIAPFLPSIPLSDTSKPVLSFWRLVEAAIEAQSNKPDSQLYESERIWRIIFSLCAISQFTVEGLTTSAAKLEAHWPVVKKALKCIRLSADERDNSRPATALHKRDAYLRLVTARCFLLCTRWSWRLNNADDMFQELCAIFRSRQFSNLLGEPDDFPRFIRKGDESFIKTYETTDTAYGLFLKLIIHANKDFQAVDDTCRLRRAKLPRLLSLAVPVGSTSFTKATPPAGQDLSMLYNRYSAIFVAIHVDSSPGSIRSRLIQASRYITFKDADCDSRTAAIRAMMHVAILLRHLDKPLNDVLSWASEMIEDLITEITPSQSQTGGPSQSERDKLIVLVQLLLGTIRTITDTPTLSHSDRRSAKYPEVGFVESWVPRVLSSPLAKDHRTGLEICKCIQSFLIARRAVIPPPPIPRPTVDQHENQESQDEYGDVDLDLNDPTVLELLGDLGNPPDENAVTDQRVSETLDGFSQALYTCVCTHLGCDATTFGGLYCEADQWLDCWLGYGSILVRNKKRNWDYYFQLGVFAWRGINDPFRRFHLRLRFMLTVLQLDPYVYKSHGNQILKLWFESLVTPDITIQHDFTARLFAVDGLRHILFQNMPCRIELETGNFKLPEFKEFQLPFVDAVLCNVSKTPDNPGIAQYITLVETLLAAVRKWMETMSQVDTRRPEYLEFSKKVFSTVRNYHTLSQHAELRSILDWGDHL